MILFRIAITWVGAERRRRLRRLRRDAGLVCTVVGVIPGPQLRVTRGLAQRVVDDVDEVSGWLGVKDSKGPQR